MGRWGFVHLLAKHEFMASGSCFLDLYVFELINLYGVRSHQCNNTIPEEIATAFSTPNMNVTPGYH